MASDSFTRANATPLDGNWATSSSWGNLQLVSNAVRVVTAGVDSMAVSTISAVGDSEVIVSNVAGNGLGGPVIHGSTTAGNGYVGLYNTGFFHIYLLPSFTDLGSFFSSIVNGDRLRIRRSGSDVILSLNTVDIVTAAGDTTYTGGNDAMFIYDNTIIDDWTNNAGAALSASLLARRPPPAIRHF